MKSSNIQDLLNGFFPFLKKRTGITERIKRIDSGTIYTYEGVFENMLSKSTTILGRKRKSKRDIINTENCIIQCVLSSFILFIKNYFRRKREVIQIYGERGIRTLGMNNHTKLFESFPFNHSGISPYYIIPLAKGF